MSLVLKCSQSSMGARKIQMIKIMGKSYAQLFGLKGDSRWYKPVTGIQHQTTSLKIDFTLEW